jgi:hypothetical protein
MNCFSAYPWRFSLPFKKEKYSFDHVLDPDDPLHPRPASWKWSDKYICQYEWLLPEDCAMFVNAFYSDWTPIRASWDEPNASVIYAMSSELADPTFSSHSIWSNIPDIAYCYVKYTEEPKLWPPYFCDCIVLDLALRLAKSFTDSLQYVAMLDQRLTKQMSIAESKDARQQYFPSYVPHPIATRSRIF